MKNFYVFCLIALFSSSMFAQSEIPSQQNDSLKNPPSNKWEISITPYLSLAGIEGEIKVNSLTVPVEASFSDILDKLGMAAMLHAEMKKGKWSLMTDLFYIKLKKGASLLNGNVPVDLELEETIFEIGAGYSIINREKFNVDLLAGARFFNLCNVIKDNDVTLLEEKLSFTDPYVGLRYMLQLKKLKNSARFDVGGFDIGSELSWKFNILLGYDLSKKSSLYIGYQGYDVDYTDGDLNYNVLTAGPILGMQIKL